MRIRYWRRKVRCMLKHGPRNCPHIERHTRRRRLSREERQQVEHDEQPRHRRMATPG